MSYEAVAALCAFHQLHPSIRPIATEDGHRRWEIRATLKTRFANRDFDLDGEVGTSDLLFLLSNWG